MSTKRIVFMGTPDFAAKSLRVLTDQNYSIVAVVTAPDRPSGRGQKINQSAVKKLALELKLPVLQPIKLRDPEFLDSLRHLKPDLIIVVAFRMLPEVVWSMPNMGTINLHASLLPQYRGAAPINWAIINGETSTGVSTFFINEKIDTGHLLLQQEVAIDENMNAGRLHDILMETGAQLITKTLEKLFKQNISSRPQSMMKEGEFLKEAPKLKKADSRIDWNQPVQNVHNLIRGLSPYPGAWTILSKSQNETFLAKIYTCSPGTKDDKDKPGTISIYDNKYLRIKCADAYLDILNLQPEGKKSLSAEEFLRGFRGTINSAQ
jgi:methionyl-tRNA formyltransferase